MILAILAAATVAGAEPSAATSQHPADVAPVEVGPDPARQLRELKQIYSQSCSDRGYMTFNDVCGQIAKQVRDAERALRRAEKKR